VHEEVFNEMLPFLKDEWGNPSSIHWAGRAPKKAVDDAREKVCKFLNCSAVELIFTSSGSESNNLAIKGALNASKKGKHVITTKVEHPAVLSTCKYLEKEGYEVTYLGVDKDGNLSLDELKAAIRKDTALITVMFANNETGVVFPIKEIAAIGAENKVLVHTDAVQAAGKVTLDVKDLGIDLLTISGHKLYAPKGIGALYVKRGVRLTPVIHGGHQERNRRAGTENVAGIVALGKACEIASRDMEKEAEHLSTLRNRLEEGLAAKVPHVLLNGKKASRLPNTTNISFEYIEGESLLLSLDMLGVAASSGSACTSGSLEPSHVLGAMGLPPESLHGSLRFSLGKSNTMDDVEYVIEKLPPIVERVRSMSPLWNDAEKTGKMIDFDTKKCG